MISLNDKDIISILDFTKEEILYVLEMSGRMENEDYPDILRGKILANLFFEPSTRTRLSFDAAMKRLGGQVIGFDELGTTSTVKGESLRDSVKIIEGYCDIIVLRHFLEGASRLTADSVGIPVINAGDGASQHPTQTFVDLYTIMKAKGGIENLSIGFLGDLKYGRTAHSLAYALAHFNTDMSFISPPSLRMPKDYIEELAIRNVSYKEVESITEVSNKLDILYCTRIQKERFAEPVEYEKVKGLYKLSKSVMDELKVKDDLKILHPLPRVDEMDESLDATEYAMYFQQAHSGIPVRKALLASILGAIQ
ncbi:MAG: aspartate carbamoyltransferase [Candidatus Scalindua sp.]|jgi:aspartate carbamoyltransferase catalytic subunit|nr:aspartate carbamoyltransferase [Candidatus Scalindua sp.]MBT5306833.1 aspartate carbamoyltransferase [Candidatus Scalindua sp.]MBT6226285.1 aspartate carbamoyltransferase [Candidatus Scalindua sp.]MBT6562311.1 aspartate carbamoyltransferase [Candidatus Scalindua sp.]MBT7212763.1 aspartate carbamoyltransferase [Candidatus Scalindua sp.]